MFRRVPVTAHTAQQLTTRINRILNHGGCHGEPHGEMLSLFVGLDCLLIESLSELRASFSDCKKGVPKLFLAMYPFSISIDEHVPLKFLMTKRLRKITKIQYIYL